MKASSFVFAAALLVAACQPVPQKGGSINAGPSPAMSTGGTVTPQPAAPQPQGIGPRTGEGMPVASLAQPENPQASSGQEISYERTTEVSVPVEAETKTETTFPDGRRVTVIETRPAGTVVKETVKQGVKQEVSGSWKDTAREIGAKLSSFRGVQVFGVALLVAAAAMFHPVVRGVVGGGKSTQMAVAGVGLALVFGPSLVVGNEKLFIFGGIGLVALVWLNSRSSYFEGKVDANKNGIPDDEEPNP